MWTTDKTRRSHITPRPLRVAYLVPDRPSHALLSVIFAESMSRWGGRRTPIILTDGATISDGDWLFLDIWDADIVYSYQPLEDVLRDRIAHCFAPSAIEVHQAVDMQDDEFLLRPRIPHLQGTLRSISVLPRLARLQEVRRDTICEVLDKEPGCTIRSDLSDSFGFLSDGNIHANVGPYARRLSFKQAGEERQAPRFRGEDSISYISNVGELEQRLSMDGKLLFPSHMSDMFCPYLNVFRNYRASWDDRLTLVIGDDEADRLLFWNSIHRYKSLGVFRGNQILRFGLDRFREGVPNWIDHLCGGVRNSRHLDGNGAVNVQVISASVDEERLAEISKAVSRRMGIMSSSRKMIAAEVITHVMNNDPRPDYEYSSIRWPAWLWPTDKASQAVRLNHNEIDVPCVRPWHIEDFPLSPATAGAWLCDHDIERVEDHSRFSNVVHRWIFPRRLAIHFGVKIDNYGSRAISWNPVHRPTERGHLSLWEDVQWRRPTIRLPQDIEAFYQALVYNHPDSVAERGYADREISNMRIRNVKISDKGRDLLGVLRFFRNLNEAATFLTNPFVLSIISKLSPTDTSRDESRISALKEEFAKRFMHTVPDEASVERAAKRLLELTSRWMQKDSRGSERINYAEIVQLSREIIEDRGNQGDVDSCIKYLRSRGVLLQGYSWRCNRCQHPNWVGLTEMQSTLVCAICDAAEDAPVGGNSNSYFRLNPFFAAAFGPASAQDSVIWCISHLMERANHSLLLAPTLDIKDEKRVPKGTDLDVLACVDGKIHYYEVKRSFAGINKDQVADLLSVSALLNPDYAGFAIHNSTNKEALPHDEIERITEELRKNDVTFVLMAGDDRLAGFLPRDLPLPIGETMRWSVWRDD